jgi:hypothetical protein
VLNTRFMLRLGLDLLAAVLLLLALAYYWQDNAFHEVVGTAMFMLLIAHNTINRRWYGSVAKRQETRKTLDKVLVFGLLTAVAILLVTSLMISQTVFVGISLPDAFMARRIHLLSAYWALILVAIHIGIRWRVVLGFANTVVRKASSGLQTVALRTTAAAIAFAGIYSSFVMGIGGKLRARVSLDGWDFTDATWSFFLHHLAIVGLFAFLSHYAFRWMQPKRGPER